MEKSRTYILNVHKYRYTESLPPSVQHDHIFTFVLIVYFETRTMHVFYSHRNFMYDTNACIVVSLTPILIVNWLRTVQKCWKARVKCAYPLHTYTPTTSKSNCTSQFVVLLQPASISAFIWNIYIYVYAHWTASLLLLNESKYIHTNEKAEP